jgi:hypothetical protein
VPVFVTVRVLLEREAGPDATKVLTGNKEVEIGVIAKLLEAGLVLNVRPAIVGKVILWVALATAKLVEADAGR